MAAESRAEQPAETKKRSRNTKRSSLACTACKRSKRRCDIEQQFLESDACTNCQGRGEPCEVRFGEDKRRRRATPGNVDIISRVDVLEKLFAMQAGADAQGRHSPEKPISPVSSGQAGLQTVPSTAILSNHLTPDDDAGSDSLKLRPAEDLTSERTASSHANNAYSPPQHRSDHFPMEAQLQTMNPFLQSNGHSDTSPSAVAPTPSASSNLDTSSTLMGRVIARESELEGQDNQGSEFFGTTSIYHLSSGSRTSCISGGLPSVAEGDKRSWAFKEEPELDPSNEPDLIVSHLLDLFWNWQAIHLQVFHRELFLAEKKLFDTERPRRRYVFFSPSLLYAIMALGAMMSPDRGVKYQSTKAGGVAGDIYFEKARKLFDEEMAEPTITTVQTALTLGSRYGSRGQSIAIRMAIQIGLHIDCEKSVACKQMSPEVAEVRKLVFWGCYIQDKLWSAYTGRPSFIMDWNITVALPQEDTRLRRAGLPSPDVQVAVHRQILLLTRNCSHILTELYSRKNEGNPENLRKAASEIHLELLTWHNDLPEVLKWPNEDGTPSSPHVLVMHMQFYFTILLLHRPFIDLHEAVATITHLAEGQPSATTICTLAATNIAKLARDYSLFYSLSQIASPAIHFIFIAATIHMINHKISPGNNHDYLFQGCLASLLEIGNAYPMSHKAAAVLQELAGRLQSPNPGTDGLGRSMNGASEPPIRGSDQESPRPLNPTTASARRTESGLYDPSPTLMNPSSGLDMTIAAVGEPRNFDWSTYNSPITLPTSLSIFDAEAFDYSGVAPTVFSSQFGCAPDANTLGSSTFTTSFPPTHHDSLPSATFFDSFYGTSFGLDY